MPQFLSGESKTAKAMMRNPTIKAFDYDGVILMGTGLTEVSRVTFHLNAGEEKQISFPVIMPSVVGTYPIYIGVFSEGKNIKLYKAEDISIVVPTPAKLEYITDIRQTSYQRPGYPDWARGISFEVDIRNTGGNPTTCTPIAYFYGTMGREQVNMGTKTINPGQTVTFSGTWYWASGPMGPDDWWRAEYIESEAGIISFEAGIARVGVDIPAQIVQGAPFWATASIWLNYDRPDRLYGVELTLQSKEAHDIDAHIRTYRDPGWTGGIGTQKVRSLPICVATIANEGFNFRQILLDHSGYYTIRGYSSGSLAVGDYPITQEPGRAIFLAEQFSSFMKLPLPVGVYDVLASLYIGTGTGNVLTSGYYAWRDLKVGEVLIMPGVSGLMNIKPGYIILPYATGGTVAASVDYVNSGTFTDFIEIHYGSETSPEYIEVIPVGPGQRRTINFAFDIPPEWEGPMEPWLVKYKMETYGHLSRVSYGFGIFGLGHQWLDSQSAIVFLV